MKKQFIIILAGLLIGTQLKAQCTFESLFPLDFGAGKHLIQNRYGANPIFIPAQDTIRGSVFDHGLDYFWTVRNFDIEIFSYTNVAHHPCFGSGDIVLNCIANDSGLVAYNYQVTYADTNKPEFMAVVDSLKKMMTKKFTYTGMVETKTSAIDETGAELSGDGVSVYFNDQPVVSSNLTYPQFVIRAGYLEKKPKSSDNVYLNQASKIQYYRIEIVFKRRQPDWKTKN